MSEESTGASAPASGWRDEDPLVGALARAAGVGAFRLDGDRRLRAVTAGLLEVTGKSREDLLGERVTALIEPADAAEVADRLTRLSTADEGTESVAVSVRGETGPKARTLVLGQVPDDGVVGVLHRREESDDEHPQFEEMVDYVEDYAIFTLDTDGTVVSWNTGAERIKGFAAADIVGRNFDVLYTAEDRAAGVPRRNLATAAADGRLEDEGWRVREDGSRFWANVVITPIRTDDGDLDGFVKITRDMTEQREQDRQLRRERDLVERVLDAAPVDIFVLGRDGEVIRTNDPDDWPGTVPERAADVEVYTPDGTPVPQEQRPSRIVFETGEPVYGREFRISHPDGIEQFASVTAVPLTDDEGRVDRAVITVEDVTRLKVQARQLKRERDAAESELGAVFERVTEAFFALDRDWRFAYVNERAAEVFGRPVEAMLGAHIWTAFDELGGTTFQAEYERAMAEQESVSFEAYFEPQDAWYAVDAYPDERGLSVYFRDVTERKERERELTRSRRRYEALVEHFPNGVVTLFDTDLRYLVAGGEGFSEYPFTADEIEGERVGDAVPADLSEQVRPHFEAALEGETRTFEATLDGRTLQFYAEPIRDEDGHVVAGMGMSQDVTEQYRRERDLETQVRQQTVVTELGQQALAADDLDALFDRTVTALAETLDAEYCKVLERLPDDELRLRAGVGWRDGLVGTARVGSERDSQAGYTLLSNGPVVVTDLESEERFSGPDLLTSHGVRSGISVVIGPPAAPWGVLGVHDGSVREFTQQDLAFVQAVANVLASAVERVTHERTLRRQREQLAALNHLNGVGREIIRALLQQSTREEVERLVCDRLAESDSYAFAWVGAVDETDDVVVLRTEAGVTGYLDDVTIRVDGSADAQGPTGRAFRTGEVQVCRSVGTDSAYEQWRERGEAYGYRASVAVPVSYEGTVYGVLNVYTEREGAFGTQERAVLAGLGDVMGHVINAIERRRLLLSDEVTEIEFRIRDFFASQGVDADLPGTVTVAETIPVGEDEYLAYGRADERAREWLDELVDRVPYWRDLSHIGTVGGDYRFEIHLEDPPVLSFLAAHGGRIKTARISDGDYHMTVELPPDASVRTVVDGVEGIYPDAEMLVQRRTTLEGTAGVHRGIDLGAILTERQEAAVEAAYYAGFFEWPRESTGEDVADALGISPPTFHQHLRAAHQRILRALLPDGQPERA